MSDELTTDEVYAEAIKRAREKFEWSGKKQEKREPILDRLPWSDDYGPHICARCRGVGWLVKDNGTNYPELVACTSCDKAVTAEVARCWTASSMKADVPNAPSLRTFEPHNDVAAAVAQAASSFIRERSGWLTLYGAPGTGKSHIAEAIARYFLTTKVPCLFTSSVNLWEYLGGVGRGEHDTVDYAERFRWVRDLPALVIDEMNVEKSTEFVFKTRRSLLDYRYRAALDGRSVTVIASNDDPATWQDAAIGDRAMDTRFALVDTGTLSYRRIKRS